MGAAKVVPSERSKSHVSYYVVMAVIVGLLAALCCYACYYFVSKIRELTAASPSPTPSTPCPKKETTSYPVQPVVRDSATAMAALCELTAGGQVHPGARSPAPRAALASPRAPAPAPAAPALPPDLPPAPEGKTRDAVPVVPTITLNAAN